LLTIILGCSISDATDTEEPIENLSTSAAYKTLNDVDVDLTSLDIYYNSDVSTKKPVVIWVHGGGWSVGD